MNAWKRIVVALATVMVAAAVGLFAPSAHAEVIGNWDFSTGSLAGTADSQVRLRHAPSTDAFTTYRNGYDNFRISGWPLPELKTVPGLEYDTTESFGIQALGAAGRTVLKVPDARGSGHLTGLIADFDNPNSGKINRYTVIMDVLIPQSTFDEPNLTYVSLFQPRANADGLLFVDTKLSLFGAGTDYKPGFTPDTWHRVALVIDLESSSARYMTYLNGDPMASSLTPGVGRLMDVNGAQSIGSLTDSNYPTNYPLFNGLDDASKSTFFLFNDDDVDLGTLYVANLQFRDTALSAGEIFALGGPTATAIAVPEPTSLAIAGTGLLCLGGAARRRQSRASSRQGRRNRA